MWVADQRFEVLGTKFRVQTNDETSAAAFEGLLADFVPSGRPAARLANTFSLIAPEEEGQRFRLYRDCRSIIASDTRTRLVTHLLAETNRTAVEGLDTLAVHAGVVAHAGQAVAFPGISGAGKTTLTMACLMNGFGYVSDEALSIDLETTEVHPYPRPLMVAHDSRDLLGIPHEAITVEDPAEVVVSHRAIGAEIAEGPLKLTHVIIPEFGHDSPALERAEPAEIMAVILRLSFNNYKHPELAFRLGAQLAGSVNGWKLSYGDPLEAAEFIRSELFAV